MKISIKHKINYNFKSNVKTGFQKVLLNPINNSYQNIIKWKVIVNGGIKEISSFDHFNNHVNLFRFNDNIYKIEYKIEGIVETKSFNGINKVTKDDIPTWCYLKNTELTDQGPYLNSFYNENKLNKNNLIQSLHELSNKIRNVVKYKKGKTNFKTTAEESLKKGFGVCQDHTHIFLSLLKLNNIPCRYISGYFFPLKNQKNLSMHAWAEVFVENLGWVSFDISNGISANERYVVVAKGFDYNSASPIKGIINGFVNENLTSKLKIKIIDQ